MNQTEIHEYLQPTEFDAYSLEITGYIKKAYEDTNNKEIIEKWICSSDIDIIDDNLLVVLNMPIPLFYIIGLWAEKNKKYIRKFRQRIYNEVIKNENNIE